MNTYRFPGHPEARVPHAPGLAHAGTGRGKPGDGRRDSSGTTGPRWKSGPSTPVPSRIAHRQSSASGSPQTSRCEAVEPSVLEGFPHIHRPYYCY